MDRIKIGFYNRKDKMVSIRRSWENTRKALCKKFEVIDFHIASEWNKEQKLQAIRSFLSQIDIGFGLPTSILTLRCEENIEIPCFFSALGTMPKGGAGFWDLRRLLRSTDGILFSSTPDFKISERLIQNNTMRTYVVPFGIDCDIFKPAEEFVCNQIRKQFQIPIDSPLLMYSGRLNIQKNIHTLLRILQELLKYEKRCQLCLVGRFDDIEFPEFNVSNDGYEEYIRKLIAQYGLQQNVIFTGQLDQTELVPMYSAADLLINCTIHHDENFGNSQVEAMACGTPVICSKWGGLQDTVKHGQTGFHMDAVLTQNGVKIDWRTGVQQILHLLRNPLKLKQMSEQSVDYARQNYGLEKYADNLENAIIDILAKAHTPLKKMSYDFTPLALQSHLRKYFVEYQRKRVGGNPNQMLWVGEFYHLYEQTIEPYASQNSRRIEFELTSVPYFLMDVQFDSETRTLFVKDPIWPRQYQLVPWEFFCCSQINGTRNVQEIIEKTQQKVGSTTMNQISEFLRKLLKEGVIYPYHTFTVTTKEGN